MTLGGAESGFNIRAHEEGGGGDCLFCSIGAVLEKMLEVGGTTAKHVSSQLPPAMLKSRSKQDWVRYLRCLSAKASTERPPEDFLDYILSCAMHERLGTFEDRWSPEKILKGTPFEVLLGSESVLAVGEAEDGDSGDLSVRVKRTEVVKGGSSYDEVLCIEQGLPALVALRCKLNDILSQEGNTHWGDINDVKALSQSLLVS